MASAFITTVKVLTTIAQIVLRLSPVPELYRVHKRKDVGVMALMPLVALLLCNHIWLIYAYTVKNIFPLFSVCVYGDVVATLYIVIYAKWCSDRVYVAKSIVVAGILLALVTTYAVLVASGAISQSRHQLGLVLGYLANVATFAMYISPLEKLKLVIQTKSSAAIPALLCGIIFVNSTLWLINGIVDDDLFIVVPNVVGLLLSATQLTLYVIYRPKKEVSAADTSGSEINAVLGLETGISEQVALPKSPAFALLVSPKHFLK
ncbi:hypothetical protein KRP22_006901 [Phytophthora ramorum]|nr:Bidirectional sugar transporter SWEET15 [Phytophthora ramorum]